MGDERPGAKEVAANIFWRRAGRSFGDKLAADSPVQKHSESHQNKVKQTRTHQGVCHCIDGRIFPCMNISPKFEVAGGVN